MRDDDQFAAIDFGPAESLRITVYEADKEHFRIMIIYHKYRIDNILANISEIAGRHSVELNTNKLNALVGILQLIFFFLQ